MGESNNVPANDGSSVRKDTPGGEASTSESAVTPAQEQSILKTSAQLSVDEANEGIDHTLKFRQEAEDRELYGSGGGGGSGGEPPSRKDGSNERNQTKKLDKDRYRDEYNEKKPIPHGRGGGSSPPEKDRW